LTPHVFTGIFGLSLAVPETLR